MESASIVQFVLEAPYETKMLVMQASRGWWKNYTCPSTGWSNPECLSKHLIRIKILADPAHCKRTWHTWFYEQVKVKYIQRWIRKEQNNWQRLDIRYPNLRILHLVRWKPKLSHYSATSVETIPSETTGVLCGKQLPRVNWTIQQLFWTLVTKRTLHALKKSEE